MPEAPADSPHGTEASGERLQPGDLYTVRDVESLFRISRRTVTNWHYAGILKPVKVGKGIYYRRADIERLVMSK